MATRKADIVSDTPVPDPVVMVSLVLQNAATSGDPTFHLELPTSMVRAILAGAVPFFRLPAHYGNHPNGETRYVSINNIMELHIVGHWPEE